MSEDASQNAPHDLPLSILIGTVESEEGRDVEIPLILNTGGLLISGELIGESTFYKEFMGGAFRERIREVLSSNEALKAEIEKAPDNGESDFIHLRNAKFLAPGQARLLEGVSKGTLWRGRLDRVDGWVLGALGTD